MKQKLTQKRLRELLHYNPETGVFKWNLLVGRSVVGGTAGSLDKDGYRHIGINKKDYKAHRLAWLYINGYFPENQVDHINRKKDDNRFKNLREVSQTCNNRNMGNPCHNTSGVKGIVWHRGTKKWRAQLMVNKKMFHLGLYKDFLDAVCARLAGEQRLNWSECDSLSPAARYVKENVTFGRFE